MFLAVYQRCSRVHPRAALVPLLSSNNSGSLILLDLVGSLEIGPSPEGRSEVFMIRLWKPQYPATAFPSDRRLTSAMDNDVRLPFWLSAVLTLLCTSKYAQGMEMMSLQ